MMAKFQRFGGAMFTPVVVFVFSGIIVGLTSVFTNPVIMGSIADPGTTWTNVWSIVDAGGWTVFNNMEVLFVIGLPLGLANKAKERAALEAFVLYMTFNNFVNVILQHWGKGLSVDLASTSETSGLKVIAGVKTLDTGVIGAILIAALVVWLHNRFFDVKLPDWLGVFQGSAFVAMIGFFIMIVVAFIFCWIWPTFQHGVYQLQFFMVKSGRLGSFMYIFLEKALLPVGLHHFIYAPFQYGPAVVEGGTTLYWMKHITTFAASNQPLTTLFPEGGFAMQGISNIFGVPGIALAFYTTAKPKNRKKVLALIVPGVLTSVFAGITEPFDYTFLFIAPVLFYVHAILAAILATTMFSLGITGDMQGGLIEMTAKNFIPMWANHWPTYILMFTVGIAFIAIYYFVFHFLILKFNFPTPGRTDDEMINMFTKKDYQAKKAGKKNGKVKDNPFRDAAASYIQLLGGAGNIDTVNNCFTRLRLTINNPDDVAIDQDFMAVGAKGVVRAGNAVQIIVGTDVTNVREEVDALLDDDGSVLASTSVSSIETQKPETSVPESKTTSASLFSPVDGGFMDIEEVPDDVFSKKLVGEGFAVNPDSNKLYAGVNATVINVFPTKHALGMRTDSGLEIMLHLGLDTVELNGDPFDIKVSEGEKVEPGTLVGTMDIDQIKAAGKNPVVLMIMTNSVDYIMGDYKAAIGAKVLHGTPIINVTNA